jgi:hypothetical protein
MFGGLVRNLIGLLKNKVFVGKQKFNKLKFWIPMIISTFIGAFCALLTVEDYRVVLLAGYAGTDLIQGLYNMTKK